MPGTQWDSDQHFWLFYAAFGATSLSEKRPQAETIFAPNIIRPLWQLLMIFESDHRYRINFFRISEISELPPIPRFFNHWHKNLLVHVKVVDLLFWVAKFFFRSVLDQLNFLDGLTWQRMASLSWNSLGQDSTQFSAWKVGFFHFWCNFKSLLQSPPLDVLVIKLIFNATILKRLLRWSS